MMRNCYAEHIDFTELSGIIESNPKFLPSDLDMIYERNGHFLIGEWKRLDEPFGGGQEIMLKALAKTENFTVIKIYGYSEGKNLIVHDIHWLKPEGIWLLAGKGKERLKEFINNWYKKANYVSQ